MKPEAAPNPSAPKRIATPKSPLLVAAKIVELYATLGEPERSYVKTKLAELDTPRT